MAQAPDNLNRVILVQFDYLINIIWKARFSTYFQIKAGENSQPLAMGVPYLQRDSLNMTITLLTRHPRECKKCCQRQPSWVKTF